MTVVLQKHVDYDIAMEVRPTLIYVLFPLTNPG